MRAELVTVCQVFEKIVQSNKFVEQFGQASIKQGDHFGHLAIIISFKDYDLTIANVSSDKGQFCTHGVYLKANSINEFDYLRNAENLVISKGGQPILLEYRLITNEWLIESPETFADAVFALVTESIKEQASKKKTNELPAGCFSPAQRKLLAKVGVLKKSDIIERGYARVYLDIKSQGGQMIKETFLTNLWGAVHSTHPTRVTEQTLTELKSAVKKLALAEFTNYINMNEQIARRVTDLGFQTMHEVRKARFEDLAKGLVRQFGPKVGHDTSLAVYAALQGENGVSVDSLTRNQLVGFEECMKDVSVDLKLQGSFAGGVADGVSAMLSLLNNNRFQNNF